MQLISKTRKFCNIKEVQGQMICSEFVDRILTLVFLLLGVIMYSGNQQYILAIASGQTEITHDFPPGSNAQYASSAGIYPNQTGLSQSRGGAQLSSTTYYPNQVVATEARTAAPMQGATSVTYSGHGLPPAYQEQEPPGHASQNC